MICDSTLKFLHCYAGQPGCMHNMRVFRLSGVETMCTRDYFPEDSHVIGDSAYALQKYVMVPYKNNGHLTEAQVNFNNRLCSARVMIERAIGLLKGCFRSLLDKLHMKQTDLIPQYVIACCVLHNICILNDDIMDIPLLVEENNINEHNDIDEQNMILNNNRQEGIEKKNVITYMLQT